MCNVNWCLCECVNEIITAELTSYGVAYHRGSVTQLPTTISIPECFHHPKKPSATNPDPRVFALRCKNESQPTSSRSKNLDFKQFSIPSQNDPKDRRQPVLDCRGARKETATKSEGNNLDN
jgi:hypothetical protein